MGHAFLLYGMTLKAAETLRATMQRTNVPRVSVFNEQTDALMKTHQPFYVDVSGHSYATISTLRKDLRRAGYQTHMYVKEGALPTMLSEAWVEQMSVYGMIRVGLLSELVVLDAKRSASHLLKLVREELTPKPKAPTEVDRLKTQQKQQLIMLKTQQNNDLLQAQTRELEKKSREQQQKLSEPKKTMKETADEDQDADVQQIQKQRQADKAKSQKEKGFIPPGSRYSDVSEAQSENPKQDKWWKNNSVRKPRR